MTEFNLQDAVADEVKSYAKDRRVWQGQIGGQKLTLFSNGKLTSYVTNKVERKFPNFVGTLSPGGMCFAIALSAEDEKGNKVFKPTDSKLLERLDIDLIGDMFGTLFGDGEDVKSLGEEVSDQEKN